jgi:indole-3-glycerol phosphate synthase
MSDFLDVLARDARETVAKGYYEDSVKFESNPISLRSAILQSPCVPIIAEVKAASPSKGVIRANLEVGKIASEMARGGAAGISVLTEPKHFNGSLRNLISVRKAVNRPILMKDIVVSVVQLDAAARIGANAVLLIQSVYNRGYGELGVDEMIDEAHLRKLEVLLEVHDEAEFRQAAEMYADLVGINNRNLATLKVDLNVTKQILKRYHAPGMLVVSESGICSCDDVRFLIGCGATAFLIGSALMSAEDVESKVREFTMVQSQTKSEKK